jgi:iron complex outermembrane receptor protein
LDYSLLNIDKKATNFDSKYALDYLKHKLVLSFEHNLFRSISGLSKLGYFDRAGNYSDFSTGNLTIYKPYIMLDYRLLWSINHIQLYTDINNILNSNYADFGGLSQPGINFCVGLKFKL